MKWISYLSLSCGDYADGEFEAFVHIDELEEHNPYFGRPTAHVTSFHMNSEQAKQFQEIMRTYASIWGRHREVRIE